MTNYKFIRQYDSPLYWVLLTICVGISIAFTVAAFAEPLTLAFAGLFALLSYAIYIGIFRRYNSGLMIDDTTLRWFRHYREDDIQIVDLFRIVRVNWKHFDSEWIVLTLDLNQAFAERSARCSLDFESAHEQTTRKPGRELAAVVIGIGQRLSGVGRGGGTEASRLRLRGCFT